MSDRIRVSQKPTCSKCRETLGILKECSVEFDLVNYYETPLTAPELKSESCRLIRAISPAS